MDKLLLRRRLIAPKLNVASGTLPLSFNARRMPIQSLIRYGKCEQRRLPKEYTELQYIASTGSQWIDTGVKGNQDSRIEVKWMYPEASNENGSGRVFGARYTSSDRRTIALGANTGRAETATTLFAQFYKTSGSVLPSDSIAINSWYVASLRKGMFTLNGTDYAMGTTDDFETPYTIKLFSFAQAASGSPESVGAGGHIRVAYYRTYDGNTLVCDLVPAKRNSDNEIGMYDLVSGAFRTNQGSDDFTAGPNATPSPDTPFDIICNNGKLKAKHQSGLPLGYTLLNYIESSGTQYIDTGITDIVGKEFILDAQLTTPLPGASTFPTQLGARDDNSGDNQYKMVFGTGAAGAKFYCQVGIGGDGFVTASAADANRHIFRCVTTANDSTYYIDEDSYDLNYQTVSSEDYSLYLCARNNLGTASNFCKQKVYGFTVKEGIAILLNLVPVKRDSDNAVGMFDLVSNTFSANQGTGDFIAGSEASDTVVVYADGTPEVLTENSVDCSVADIFAVGNYVDEHDLISGLLTQNVGVKVLNGTESWSEASTNVMQADIISGNALNEQLCLCTHFTHTDSSTFMNMPDNSFRNGSTTYTNRLYIKSSVYATDATTFANFLASQYAAGTPVIVLYQLATPVIGSVAPQPLDSDEGSNTVSTVAEVSNPEALVKYYK